MKDYNAAVSAVKRASCNGGGRRSSEEVTAFGSQPQDPFDFGLTETLFVRPDGTGSIPVDLDAATLERALRGDRDAFHEIASSCWGMVFVFVRQRVRDAELARDLTQEVFLTAYAKRESLRKEESFVAWLLTIASRKIIDQHRRRQVRPEVPLQGADEETVRAPSPEAEGIAESAEEAEQVNAALDHLDDRYRAVLILRYWSGLAPSQIARLLGEPEGTIRNRIFRAHARLRDRLDREQRPVISSTSPAGSERQLVQTDSTDLGGEAL